MKPAPELVAETAELDVRKYGMHLLRYRQFQKRLPSQMRQYRSRAARPARKRLARLLFRASKCTIDVIHSAGLYGPRTVRIDGNQLLGYRFNQRGFADCERFECVATAVSRRCRFGHTT